MARLLLIDDDPELLDVLSLALEGDGYELTTARDGDAGWSALQKRPPHLIISDVNMPGLDGFSLCRRLREGGDNTPLILLTSRDNDIDEALGLELGADDYVTKPFSTRVLLARCRTLLRRQSARQQAAQAPPASQDLHIDPERLELRWRGKSLVTTVTEFRLMETLGLHPGRVYSRSQLLVAMRGDDSVVEARIVDTYIRRLRRKFEAVDERFGHIETVVGVGYRWKDDG